MRGDNRRKRRADRPLGASENTAPVDPGAVPMPAILDPRVWTIEGTDDAAGQAWVERGDGWGRMRVPTTNDDQGRRVRLHEMAHVRWTPSHPTCPDGVRWETLNAVEDRRIHSRLKEIGMGATLKAPILTPSHWNRWAESFEVQNNADDDRTPWPPIEIARMIVASDGTAESSRFRDLVQTYGHGWVIGVTDAIVARHLNGRRPAFRRTLECAVELEAVFAELEDLPETIANRLPDYNGEPGGGRWGEMTIREMDLSVRLPRGMVERVRRATDNGAVPRNWSRLSSDGRVFSHRRKRPGGGTVLIDQSGSMGLDPDEVLALMVAFPAVTIATYAGSGERGELRVIARNGKRATDSDCHHPMGGNIIDGPALEWLADQPGPRVWISDGYVTGTRDSGGDPMLLVEAAAIVKRGKIVQRDRLGDLLPEGGGPR